MKTFDLILEISNVPENTYYDLLALIGNKAKVKVTEIEQQSPPQDKWDKINEKFDKAIKEEFEQSNAVEFAEWCPDNGFTKVKTNGDLVWIKNDIAYTSKTIYEIFRKEKGI